METSNNGVIHGLGADHRKSYILTVSLRLFVNMQLFVQCDDISYVDLQRYQVSLVFPRFIVESINTINKYIQLAFSAVVEMFPYFQRILSVYLINLLTHVIVNSVAHLQANYFILNLTFFRSVYFDPIERCILSLHCAALVSLRSLY
jgi:hypothetical protein